MTAVKQRGEQPMRTDFSLQILRQNSLVRFGSLTMMMFANHSPSLCSRALKQPPILRWKLSLPRPISCSQDALSADLMQPGCLVIADRFAGLNESSLDEFNVQHELELRRSPVIVVFLSSLANIRAAVRALRQGAVSFLEKPVDPEELGDAVAEGLERALRRAQRNRLAERFESLSKRERQIFVLICRGLKNGDIAALLELSQRTVEVHRAHISRKLGDAAPIRLLYELILAEGETLFNVSFDGIRPEGLAKVFAATK